MKRWFVFVLVLAVIEGFVVVVGPGGSGHRQIAVRESLREKALERQRLKEASKQAEEDAAARARLELDYAAYSRTKGFSGESIDSFEERRESVRRRAQRNGFVAFGFVIALNLRLALAPADIKAVASDPNGICVAPRGDRLRPGQQQGLNSYGAPCTDLTDFLAKLFFLK